MSTLKSGKLRHRVVIETRNDQQSSSGAVTVVWEYLATVWASVEPLSVREFIQSQATQSEITARIMMRYRPDVNATVRFIHKGKIYNPVGVLPDAQSGIEHITIPVSEGVNDGE